MEYLLGIDAGTSACKASLVDHAGAAISAVSDPYGFDAPQPEWAEQDAAIWWRGCREAVARVLAAASCEPGDVAAIGVTGQMHSAVVLGDRDEVLRPPLLWCDQRPAEESAQAERELPEIREITLNPLLPAFTLSKLLWIRTHEPDVFGRIRHVLMPKDYLRLRLTGEILSEPSDAAGTGMFDARTWCWSKTILDRFEIPVAWLPACVPSSAVAGRMTTGAATELGLRAGTPVVAGGGDQAAQAVGAGATDAATLVVQIGTSGVIVAATDRPVPGAFCHAVPGRWLRLDSLHAAGLSLEWIRDATAPGLALREITLEAEQVRTGADGLLFMPFLMGERAGFAASVPATFSGLRPGHGRGHLVRAVLEGVAFELRRMRDSWFDDDGSPDEVRLVGGGVRDPLWQQVLADTFDVPIMLLARDSAYGAAVLAGTGIGWWLAAPPPVDAVRLEPDPGRAAAYRVAYGRYRALYGAMRALVQQKGLAE